MQQTRLAMALGSAKQEVLNPLLEQNNATAFRAKQSTTFLKRNVLGRLI
jgi:hypothetical protein